MSSELEKAKDEVVRAVANFVTHGDGEESEKEYMEAIYSCYERYTEVLEIEPDPVKKLLMFLRKTSIHELSTQRRDEYLALIDAALKHAGLEK